ncbi:helix-turn-helix domain-containing protein [Xenorhabdus nematophila]|uniref:helix-turn-helix domain-containing protein n=1 Tax=Xenorhabdus nematophila TaxID=628 RepID=UPI0032B70F47
MKKEHMNNNPLSVRLDQLMETRGISKSDMAKICNVTPQSVNGWYVRGSIGKKSAMKLSDSLGVSVAWILGESDEDASINDAILPRPELTNREKILLELFNELPDSEADLLLKNLEEKKRHYDKLLEELLHKRKQKKA